MDPINKEKGSEMGPRKKAAEPPYTHALEEINPRAKTRVCPLFLLPQGERTQ